MSILDSVRDRLAGPDTAAAQRAEAAARLAAINLGTAPEAVAAMAASTAAKLAIAERDAPKHAARRAIAARMRTSIRVNRERAKAEAQLRALPLPAVLARFKGQLEAHQRDLESRWNELTAQPFTPGTYEALSRKVRATGAALLAVRALETEPLTPEELGERIGALRAALDDVLAQPDVDPDIAAAAAEAERTQRAIRGWG